MTASSTRPRGIQWSAPVLIRAEKTGLAVTIPQQVIDALRLGAGDVLNFTQLPDGSIEVWMVKKGGYASLDDMQPAAAATKPAARKTAAKKSTTKKAKR